MQTRAIDIHHHYMPEGVVGEAKRHGNALGIQISEDKDGTIRFSFNDGPRYPLPQGLTDVDRRLEMMDKGKIVLAALDPSTQLMGYDLKGEQAESWCRLYNECVKSFSRNTPIALRRWLRFPSRNQSAPPVFWSTQSPSSTSVAPISPPTSTIVITTARTSILSGLKRRS
jgi:hypothetical protein